MAAPTILLVDDDPLILATLAVGLREHGFQTITASDPESALTMLKSQKPDMVILDYDMPGTSGLKLARAIADTCDVPFMFLSAFSDESIYKDALNLGAIAYLVKPLDPVQIAPSIWAGLQNTKTIHQLRSHSADLTTALHADRDVSVVIGLLMERLAVNRGQAYEALRLYARNRQRTIKEVGREILDSAEMLGGFLAELQGLLPTHKR